jgi:protein-disulfide isomerase
MEQQRLAQAQKDRKIRLAVFGGGLGLIVIIVVVAVVGLNLTGRGGDVTPLHGDEAQTGITPNLDVAAAAPVLEIFSDYQCPGCASYEAGLSDTLESIIDDGSAKVVFRTMTFNDQVNGTENAQSSTRAAVAAACADTLEGDYYFPMYAEIFANQPSPEGVGFSDEQLRTTFPTAVGITADQLTDYQTCYDKRLTGQFVQSVDNSASADNVRSTPTYRLNGTNITQDINPATADDAGATLRQMIADVSEG